MNIKIGESIYRLRKQNNLTQEQLATLLNVSNAAISKWENGTAYPDIEVLLKIARVFRVSIDYLYNHRVENEDVDLLIKNIEELKNEGKIDQVLENLEEALKVYPNDLNLNLLYARSLLNKALNQSKIDKDLAKEAIRYFDKTLVLDKEGKNKESIIQNKSFVLRALGEYEEAIKLLNSLNQDKYRVQIADIYLKIGKYQEAMKMLQLHLNSIAFDFAWLGGILKECFEKFSLEKEAYDIIKMVAYFREFMADSKDANYYNFLCSKDFLDYAKLAYKKGDFDQMWEALKKATYHAVRFDKNPSFEVAKVNFMYEVEGSFFNGKVAASKYLYKVLKKEFNDLNKNPKYLDLVKQLEPFV